MLGVTNFNDNQYSAKLRDQRVQKTKRGNKNWEKLVFRAAAGCAGS